MSTKFKRAKKLRPAVKWHGGKFRLAKQIVSMLPAHTIYVEPYAGGLNVLLNKRRSEVEVAGDIDAEPINFYHALQDHPSVLIDRLRSIPYEAESFAWATSTAEEADPLERAARFVVRYRFSRGGLSKTFSWSERLRGNQPGDRNAWETMLAKELPRIARRLHGVQFVQGEALELIRRHDGPDTLFYLDPPYLHATRTARNAYLNEMSDQAHARLLETVVKIRGMVVLSGYPHPLFDEALRSWERKKFERPNDAGQTKTKQRRTEILWLNPACHRFRLG